MINIHHTEYKVIVSDIPAHRWVVGETPVALYLGGTEGRDIANGIKAFLEAKATLRPELGPQITAGFSVEQIAADIERHILFQLTGAVPQKEIGGR